MPSTAPRPHPGLRHQAGARTFFRIAGCVLAPLGIAASVYGFVAFVRFDDPDGMPGREMALFMGGFVVFALGAMFLNAGFGGLAARYGAGESMPVVKDSASYLSDGQGIMGVGRTVDDAGHLARSAAASGPYCRACGVRNDTEARFCDSCGGGLV